MDVARSNRRHSARPPKRPARTSGGGSLDLVIDSDFSQGHQTQEKIVALAQAQGFDEQSIFAIKLALEEALINAIKHGNKLDRSKKVHVSVQIDSRQAQIVIEDEGPGFKRMAVPDPTCEENVGKSSGRGILLMEAYMNSVKWSKAGRRVTLIKRNERASATAPTQ